MSVLIQGFWFFFTIFGNILCAAFCVPSFMFVHPFHILVLSPHIQDNHYPFEIDLNRSNYRVVIRTAVCTHPDICLCPFNTVSKSGVNHYVVDLVPCFAVRTTPCVFPYVWFNVFVIVKLQIAEINLLTSLKLHLNLVEILRGALQCSRNAAKYTSSSNKF